MPHLPLSIPLSPLQTAESFSNFRVKSQGDVLRTSLALNSLFSPPQQTLSGLLGRWMVIPQVIMTTPGASGTLTLPHIPRLLTGGLDTNADTIRNIIRHYSAYEQEPGLGREAG